ncbi:hypothetical protein POM88_038401 [Heracleum sosnowskyi]|uniref:DUF3615 domain-containing protein n=1 Tax=Heracleum sosnowskyi TaxID=360622 RepID=A0AAD8H8G6_9APIA|nr:hypothetical protein POM88_038401 [Heracleum sosnowskyi]
MFLSKNLSLKHKPCSKCGSRSRLRKFRNRRSKKEREVLKRARDTTRPYAVEAVKFYNDDGTTDYKLVKPGFMKTVVLPTCFLHHINFTAKDANVADAQEELFFAELTTPCGVTHGAICVRCCQCMGPRGSYLGDKLNGCFYCRTSRLVQHPRLGGFTRGGDGFFKTDLVKMDPIYD